MGDIGAIIGIVTGLISMFTFLTGASSLQLLRAESRAAETGQKTPSPPRPRVYVRSRALVWLTFAAFIASLAVTLLLGLSGGDVGGAVFVLLLIGGIGVIGFVLRFRHTISPLSFGAAITVVLAVAGFAMGSVSRGEEAIDTVAGVVIGLCITVIAWMFRAGDPSTGTVSSTAADAAPAGAAAAPNDTAPADADREKLVLQLAAEQAGEVTIANVALRTALSLDDSRTLLDGLHERGFCERTRTEQGATVYRFADLA
jgi:hypothetical protein